MSYVLKELVEDKVVEASGPPPTSLKRQHRTYPVPVDSSLLQCTTRLNAETKDFEDKTSAALLAPLFEGRQRSKTTAPPHLSVSLAQSIGVDFYKAPPSELSKEALLESDDA